jgi:hypothetical protein
MEGIEVLEEKMVRLLEQRQIEESLEQEYKGTLKERVKRYLKVKPHPIIAGTHFAPVSAEIPLLFRDGHYYGCIALTQAVAEALVRFMCMRNRFDPEKDFKKNTEKLYTRKFIKENLRKALLKVWENRDAYHHLNPNIEKGRKKLEELAFEKVRILREIEKEIFDFTVIDGSIKPNNPKYWDMNGKHTQAFLRFSP